MSIKNVTTKSNEFLNCMFGVIEKDMEMVDDCPPAGADPGFFLGGGALISCSTSTPINHIVFFFGGIPVVLENSRSS